MKGSDKRNQKLIAEGGRAKIIASQTKFVYCKSMNFSEDSRSNKDKLSKTDDDSTEECEEPEIISPEMEKTLLVKVPKASPR